MDSRFSYKKSGVGSAPWAPYEWDGCSEFSSSPRSNFLKVWFVQASDFSHVFESVTPHILAVLGHGSGDSVSAFGKGLSIDVHLPQLSQPPLLEVWGSSAPVCCDQAQDIRLAFTDETVFGCLEVSEPPGSALEDVARAAYERIMDYCVRSGYAHLLRMWNYFPSINQKQQGLERYRRFCLGRHQAFSTYHKELASILPAASAVGSRGGPFQVLFLAGKQPGKPLENPRQISAYEYPPIYGPQSPSFSRATLHRTLAGCQLFVSGTASIVGHATRHMGNPVKQTRETLKNIQRLLQEADLIRVKNGNSRTRKPNGILKVYIRTETDISVIQDVISEDWCQNFPSIFLLGDLCRENLLMEVEGIF